MATNDERWAWYARAESAERGALGVLRVRADVEWLLDGDWIWLRGSGPAEEVAADLGRGGATLFCPSTGNGLVRAHPPGQRVPTAIVPEGPWSPANELVAARASAPMLSGGRPHGVPLGLARGGAPREAAAIRAPLGVFAEWALSAPAARLEPLTFFVDGSRQAFVIGRPLPPIAGTLYWSEAGLFVPVGMRFEPNVEPATARAVLGRLAPGGAADDHFVMETSGATRLPVGVGLPVRRASLRATMAGLVGP